MGCGVETLCSFLTTSIGYMIPRLVLQLGGGLEDIQPVARLLAAMTLIDFPSIMVLVFLMASPLGHRQVIGGSAIVLASCFMTLAWSSGDSIAMIAAVFLLKLSAFPALAPYHVLKNESFPTVLRMTACGLSSLFGKGGAILAPALFEYLSSEMHEQLPDHAGYHHGHHAGGHAGVHTHRARPRKFDDGSFLAM